MSLAPGKYNCVRPKCHILLVAAATPSETNPSLNVFSSTLVVELPAGEHGNDTSAIQAATFSGSLKIEGRVVTIDWKEYSTSRDENDDDPKTTTSDNPRRIKVHRSSGMIMPEGDGILITGALPYEAQGISHGGFRFKLEKKE